MRHYVFHVLEPKRLNLRSVRTTTTRLIMRENSLALLQTVKRDMMKKRHRGDPLDTRTRGDCCCPAGVAQEFNGEAKELHGASHRKHRVGGQ